MHAWEIAMAMCLAAAAPITAARVVLPDLDRGPLRPFSDRGFRDVAEYLNRTAAPGAGVVGLKEFAVYYHGPVYPLETVAAVGGIQQAIAVARRPEIRFIVESTKYPTIVDPTFIASLPIARVETVGDYRVYVKP